MRDAVMLVLSLLTWGMLLLLLTARTRGSHTANGAISTGVNGEKQAYQRGGY